MLSNTLIKCKHCNSTNCHIAHLDVKTTEGVVTHTNPLETKTTAEEYKDSGLMTIDIWIHCDECNRSSILTLKFNLDDVSLEYLTYDEHTRRKKLK